MSQLTATNESPNISSPRKQSSVNNPQTEQSMRQTRSRALRSKTQDVYMQYRNPPRTKKRKFVQHSIFLPVISKHIDNKSSKNTPKIKTEHLEDHSQHQFDQLLYGSGAHSRNKSNVAHYSQPYRHQDYDREQNEEFGTTMKYINECERIIINLRNLTDQSQKKLKNRHKRTISAADETYGNQFYPTQDPYEITPRSNVNLHKRYESNNKQTKSKNQFQTVTTRPRQQKYEPSVDTEYNKTGDKNKVNKKNTIDIENLQSKTNNLKKQDSNFQRHMSETMLKLEQENKKAQARQKIFIKFLGKAKNRGVELERKIFNFKKKKSQQKQHNQKMAQDINNKKDEQQTIKTTNPQQSKIKSKR